MKFQKIVINLIMTSILITGCNGTNKTNNSKINKLQSILFYKTEGVVIERESKRNPIQNGSYHVTNYKYTWNSEAFFDYSPTVGHVTTTGLVHSDSPAFISQIYEDFSSEPRDNQYHSFKSYFNNQVIQFDNIGDPMNWSKFDSITACKNSNKLMYFRKNINNNMSVLYQYNFITNTTTSTALSLQKEINEQYIHYCNDSDYISIDSSRYPSQSGVYDLKTGQKVFPKIAKFDNKFSKYIVSYNKYSVIENYYDIETGELYKFNPQYNFQVAYIKDNGLMLGKNQFGYTIYDIYSNKQYLLIDILKNLNITDVKLNWKNFQFDISNNGKYLIITRDVDAEYNYIIVTFDTDIKSFLINNISPVK